ncbi:holo-ACP synthase [Rhizobium leguminosarum]|uniref:holo-ACP synthase n=1 Tax=Rhizobium leguminosarum TaxID=384 RepID=UPI003F9A80D1
MIVGLGSDLVNVERIRRSVDGLGERWVNKVLVRGEIERASAWNDAMYIAKLFAAKEACSKALGTGMMNGVHWHDFEIVLPNKAIFSNNALHRLNEISGEAQQGYVFLDVFCRNGLAGAIVVISNSRAQR